MHRRLDPILLAVIYLLAALASQAAAQCNLNPVANDDTLRYFGGSAVVIDVLANDLEPDGEVLTVGNLSTTCAGTVGGDFGLVTLTLASYSEECSIQYRITDESGRFDTATVTVADGTRIFLDDFETGDPSRWPIVDRGAAP